MTWTVRGGGPLRGTVRVPGDKSITHRAYLLGALGTGETRVERPLEADDCRRTLAAVRALGAEARREGEAVVIAGRGASGFTEPGDVLDLGNSGTSTRLLAGLLAGQPFFSALTGDASLRRRPMARVAEPLRRMGAVLDGRGGGSYLPLSIRGGALRGIRHQSPVASAQVKSCLLIAGLLAEGVTTVVEPALSRDHTERMLGGMGVRLRREGLSVSVEGGQRPRGGAVRVPGDLSSAAFLLAAGAAVPGSLVTVEEVGVNPTRTGLLDLLAAMGAALTITPRPDAAGEPVADLSVAASSLRALEVPPEWIPRLIDELPVIAVLAAAAEGTTVVRGAEELRAKESDRIATTVAMLQAAGVKAEALPDGFRVEGRGGRVSPFTCGSSGDHRIAMSCAVLGLLAGEASRVEGTACVETSFPGFPALLSSLADSPLLTESPDGA